MSRLESLHRFADQSALRAHFGHDEILLVPGASLTVGRTVTLGAGVSIDGAVVLGKGCVIGNGSQLTDVVLGASNRVRPYSILSGIRAGARNLLGPFCFLRDGCEIGDDCILGAHVEAARSRFADGVKISHRAFVGDADVGLRSVVGAGVVFCNWDGTARQATAVGADVMLGSGTLLVSPLTIGDGAVVAAGSTITRNVPPGARVIQKRG